jgi:hypothetical protein
MCETKEVIDRHWVAWIVETVDLAGAVRYIIEVAEAPRKWLVRRRYSDFHALHRALTREFTAGLPRLPPKCFSPFGPDPDFLQLRRGALQRYLDVLAAAPPFLKSHPLVIAFIDPSSSSSSSPSPSPSEPAGSVDLLPQFFPDLPVRGHEGVEAVVDKAARALRRLVVLQYSLEVDEADAPRQCATFDVQRAGVAEALVTLRSVLPELERQLADAIPGKVELRAEFIAVAHRAIAWAETFDAREANAIKRALRDQGADVRPLAWYEGRVAAILSDFTDPGSGSSGVTTSQAQRTEELRMQLRKEMENRSKANQAASVTRLRALAGLIEGPRGSLAEQLRSRQVTPQSVLAMLQKRGRDMTATVDLLLSGDAGDDLERPEVLSRLE